MADTNAGGSTRPREQWTGQTGFILSAIGSAVGLGNIWRFPGVAYENGGGAFLIPYLVALITAGIPILFLDYAIGHRFRGGAPTAFRRLGGSAHRWLESVGWFQTAINVVIGLYYTAVVAWALSFFVFSIDLRWGDDPSAFFFGDYLQTGDPVISTTFVPSVLVPLVLVWIAAAAVLALGVAKGLQRANVIVMPVLVIAFLLLVVQALFLDGAMDGLNALFTPDWGALIDPNVWIAAYGQVFFSLSIAFGIMITYSSYRRRRANLTGPGLVVAFANSSFELLAGIGVFAAVGFLAFQQGVGIEELEGLTGVSLSFITFPTIVSQMPGGTIFGVLFFGSLAMAGFTSLLSVLQVVVAAIQDKFDISARAAAIAIGLFMGIPSVFLFGTTSGILALDTIDQFVNNIGIVASAVATCILLIWVLRKGPELRFHLNSVSTFQVGPIWIASLGLLVPLLLGYMLVARIWTLATQGYEDLPGWYLGVFGWGSVVFLLVAAVVMYFVPWRRSPDAFEPWPVYVKELQR